jgi:chloramphenicol-sensitive protein RarD
MNKGIIPAASAYILWGFLPLYFKFVHDVPALETVAHRVIWSVLLLVAILALRRNFGAFRASLNRRTVLIFSASAALLAVNWLVYVYAVTSGFVVETSLGYFINPLVNVLLGTIIFHERLRLTQWIPIGLAALGVAYLTFSLGSLPWIALALAFTFGLYGLVKKVAPLGSLYGLTLETSLLFIPASAYLIYDEITGAAYFGHAGIATTALLLLLGAVTAVPLLLFARGARQVPMTTLGLLQYIAPTLQFLTGVFLYGEPVTTERLVGFGIIWTALAIYSVESILNYRRAGSVNQASIAIGR